MARILRKLKGIDQALMKVDWAKGHLEFLDNEIASFLNRPPYRVLTKDDLYRREYAISVSVDPIPAEIPLILGDFISCLRSSLDHLAGALTKIPAGTYNDKASFPIIGVDNTDGRRLFKKSTEGVAPLAVNIIESLQPYKSGNSYESTKMWRLHRLWNIDKHRRIPHRATTANISLRYPSSITPISTGRDHDDGEARFNLADKPYIQFNPTVDIGIQFGDESEGIIVDSRELIDIYEFVRNEAFPRFESFF